MAVPGELHVLIERERTVIGAQIEATDRQIDRLVYELYGLTDDEKDRRTRTSPGKPVHSFRFEGGGRLL
jgi:hypothetical protein